VEAGNLQKEGMGASQVEEKVEVSKEKVKPLLAARVVSKLRASPRRRGPGYWQDVEEGGTERTARWRRSALTGAVGGGGVSDGIPGGQGAQPREESGQMRVAAQRSNSSRREDEPPALPGQVAERLLEGAIGEGWEGSVSKFRGLDCLHQPRCRRFPPGEPGKGPGEADYSDCRSQDTQRDGGRDQGHTG